MSRQSISAADRRVLTRWAAGDEKGVLRQRARIVLLADAGTDVSETARMLGTTRTTVSTWRARFAEAGLCGLADQPRPGRTRAVHDVDVVRATVEPPPGGPAWTTRSLGQHLGVSNGTVARVWRRWGLDPRQTDNVRPCTAPELPGPLDALVGIYADPAVQLLAVRLRGVGPAPWPTGASRPTGLLPRTGGFPRAVPAPDAAEHRLWRFCAAMQRCASGGTVHLVRFDGRPDPVRDEVRDRLTAFPALRLHVPAPGVTWTDAVQVVRLVLATRAGLPAPARLRPAA